MNKSFNKKIEADDRDLLLFHFYEEELWHCRFTTFSSEKFPFSYYARVEGVKIRPANSKTNSYTASLKRRLCWIVK